MLANQTTIKDIAKELKLSLSTVSRALRGHPDVNAETKKKILELAQQLNYEKNPLALSFRNQKTNSIGVIVPEIANPFFSTIISGVQHMAYEAGLNVMICLSDESIEREISNLKHLLHYRVDGLIAAVSIETNHFEHFEQALSKNVPMIFIDRVWDNPQVSKVLVDDYDGAFTITQHLLEMGYRHIAHIAGPKGLQVTQNRCKGYADALKSWNLIVDNEIVMYGGFTQEYGAEACKRLLDLPQKPDAIFCVNDRTAIGAMLVLKEKFIKIPDEIAIAGFTNASVSTIIEPNLTTMAQPAFEMGQIATEMLIKYLQNDEYTPETRILKTQLIIRDSTKKK